MNLLDIPSSSFLTATYILTLDGCWILSKGWQAGQTQGKPGLFPFLKELSVLHIDCGQHPEGDKANEDAETPEDEVREIFRMEIQRVNAVSTGKLEGEAGEQSRQKEQELTK